MTVEDVIRNYVLENFSVQQLGRYTRLKLGEVVPGAGEEMSAG